MQAREAPAAIPMTNIRAIVTDVEGTATSIAFVKETLFPYARAHLADFVAAHADDAEVASLLAEARALSGRPDYDRDQTVRLLQGWIDADKKATPLKALQGLVWQDGYSRGELVGDVYADAADYLRRWHAAGIRLYVYSSGSVQAQRLIFGYTPHGDLTPLFSGFFDTRIGGKLDQASYHAIAAAIDTPPAQMLFLSDNAGELDAARLAGMRTWCLDRGEAVVSPAAGHPVAADFSEITLDRL
jgi:enolase-phosphatase E1